MWIHSLKLEAFLVKIWDPAGIWRPHYLRFVPRTEVGLRKPDRGAARDNLQMATNHQT
jgi:hypothetical protein